MGKLGTLDWTIFKRKDPVTGETDTLIRKGDARQTSRELKMHQACVARNMRGECFTVRGNPRASALNVRNALRAASQACENNPDAVADLSEWTTGVCSPERTAART